MTLQIFAQTDVMIIFTYKGAKRINLFHKKLACLILDHIEVYSIIYIYITAVPILEKQYTTVPN